MALFTRFWGSSSSAAAAPAPAARQQYPPPAPPQGSYVVFTVGAQDVLVLVGLVGAVVGGFKIHSWNQRRLRLKEEKRKAREKQWAIWKKQATDVACYTAVLAGVGLASYGYFKLQQVYNNSSSNSTDPAAIAAAPTTGTITTLSITHDSTTTPAVLTAAASRS